jgi:hypothetical protein
MTDEELEVWRREWHSQPGIPLDLIRRVERQTVYMRLEWLAQIAPALIGAGTIVAAVLMQTIPWILLAFGTWLFIILEWVFLVENRRGVWAPTAETTAAYVGLSIERCRRKLKHLRYGNAMTVLLTLFVLVADYQILNYAGALNSAWDFVVVGIAFAIAALAAGCILLFQARKRRKTETELAYLVDLQRQLGV